MRNIKAKNAVIKIGTNTLTGRNGKIEQKTIENLVSQIASIKDGRKITIITSGAIGSGMKELGLLKKPQDVLMKQVCAGIGQGILMSNYYRLFGKHGIKVAQILLSYSDFKNKKTYRNLMNSLRKMHELGVIPIINENDPISIDEIGASFGDNDALCALIATKINADLLVILTNVDGLYDKDPREKSAKLIKEVFDIDRKIESASGAASSLGLGGMRTKVAAAKLATSRGINVIVANGRTKGSLLRIFRNEEIGTIFYPRNCP